HSTNASPPSACLRTFSKVLGAAKTVLRNFSVSSVTDFELIEHVFEVNKMDSQRPLTTKELLDMVEDIQFWEADIYITPPADGHESEEDSEDDESPIVDINHLSGRQLEAQATGRILTVNGLVDLGIEDNLSDNDDNEDWDAEDDLPLAQIARKKTSERKWEKTDLRSSFPVFTPPVGTPPVHSDAVSCFESFLNMDILTYLKNMFEKYAKQRGDHNFQTNVNELRCFIAILYVSGHLQVSRWRMLWEVDTDTYNPLIANSMRRNRFETLKRFAHCADNDNLAQGDKFAKVRPLFDKFNKIFLEYAPLEERLSLDESMVPYFGRHGAKQFIKGKPIRYGYKVWSLCNPAGYLIQFHPYQGKENDRPHMELGLGGSVVMTLVSKLPNDKPFKIYTDRYFSSLKLVQLLQNMGFGYTGTIQPNRTEKCPLPSKAVVKKSPRGTYDYLTDTNTNISITSWNDNTPFLIISSCDTVLPVREVNRWISSEKKKLPVPQPNVVGQYNKFMGGVARMDQNVNNYRINIRSKKWWWTLFVFCLDTAMHNAWQFYRRQNGCEKVDFLKFRREITNLY
ncbi:unnamed protein product, partial [Callosobruchus maculatus]